VKTCLVLGSLPQADGEDDADQLEDEESDAANSHDHSVGLNPVYSLLVATL